MKNSPRIIDPAKTFEYLVQWFHDEIIIHGEAPGFLVGLSGTDSLVTFLAAYKALERAGKSNRMLGVHFAPSEDFLYDHPEAEVHLWFREQIIPWLTKQAPDAQIIVDTSIDWRCDGQRWGALMDMSVVSSDKRRMMRLPEEQYWVVGTRNLTEDTLLNYSNVSTAASLQPLIHLWKSEVLQLSEFLGIPQIAITKSCETDCICGREKLASDHIKEIDSLLMVRVRDLSKKYIEDTMEVNLQRRLTGFIISQIKKNQFKIAIPYSPSSLVVKTMDPLVAAFEDGTLNVKEFNHRKHLYIAWVYLKTMNLDVAVERYMTYLKPLLESAGQSFRLSLAVTQAYFTRLEAAMKEYPAETFDELVEKSPNVLSKISA